MGSEEILRSRYKHLKSTLLPTQEPVMLGVFTLILVSIFITYCTNKIVRNQNNNFIELKGIRTISILLINFGIAVCVYFLIRFQFYELKRLEYLYLILFVNGLLILFYYKHRHTSTSIDMFFQTSLSQYVNNKNV